MKTTSNETISKEIPYSILNNGMRGIRAGLKLSNVKTADEPTLEFIASDETLDRAGEIIRPKGWILDRYRQNPVFQNSHQYGDIIFTIGKSEEIEIRTDRASGEPYLYQRVRFAVDENPFARIAYNLYKGGFLNAVSVGFRPIRWLDGKEAAPARRIYIEQELVEVSAVAIPSNHNALILSAKNGDTKPQDIEECCHILRSMLATYENFKSTQFSIPRYTKHGLSEFRPVELRCSQNQNTEQANPWRRLRLLFAALTEALEKINAE